MVITKQDIIQLMDDAVVQYKIMEHKAIYTVQEGETLQLPNAEAIAKSLFLRDDKKQDYYLLSLPMKEKIDLKKLRKKINSRRLCFASESELNDVLGLSKGAVTPFGILNDRKCIVHVLIDSIYQERQIAIPLIENTATVWLKAAELFQIIEKHGNSIQWVDLSCKD